MAVIPVARHRRVTPVGLARLSAEILAAERFGVHSNADVVRAGVVVLVHAVPVPGVACERGAGTGASLEGPAEDVSVGAGRAGVGEGCDHKQQKRGGRGLSLGGRHVAVSCWCRWWMG